MASRTSSSASMRGDGQRRCSNISPCGRHLRPRPAAVAAAAVLFACCAIAGGAAAQRSAMLEVMLADELLRTESALVVPGPDASSRSHVVAPHVLLDAGERLRALPDAASPQHCSEACWQHGEDCALYYFCPEEGGCELGDGRAMAARECWLMAAPRGGGAVPTVARAGARVSAKSGFPLRLRLHEYRSQPAFSYVPGRAIADLADDAGVLNGAGPAAPPPPPSPFSPARLACPGSAVPGFCALPSVESAMLLCTIRRTCRAVVVFEEGVAGFPGPLAFLSSISMAPSNMFYAPSVFTLGRSHGGDQYRDLMLSGDGEVLPSSPEEQAAGWNGSAVVPRAVVGGVVLREGGDNLQPSADACSRSCATFRGPRGRGCNVWNWCDPAEGRRACSFRGVGGVRVALPARGCELRDQRLASRVTGLPPLVLGKGAARAAGFVAGFPLTVGALPALPGYRLLLARGHFIGGFPCADTILPQYQECILPASLDQLRARCDANRACRAFSYIPGGLFGEFGTQSAVGIMKNMSIEAAMFLFPNGVTYEKVAPPLYALWHWWYEVPGASAALTAAAGALVAATVLAGAARRLAAGAAPAAAGSGAPVAKAPPGGPLVKDLDSAGRGTASAASAGAGGGAGGSAGGSAGAGSSALALGEPLDSWAHDDSLELLMRSHVSSEEESGGRPLLAAELPASLQQWLIAPGECELLRWPGGELQKLGGGIVGTVYKGVYRGEVVAVKQVPLDGSASARRSFVVECLRLHALRHPQIICLVGVSVEGSVGSIVMEYAEGRDLYTMLPLLLTMPGGDIQRSDSGAVGSGGAAPRRFSLDAGWQPQPDASAPAPERVFGWYQRGRRVAYDISRALNYLHARGVVHMDIKSNNVLLSAQGGAKLGDVGFARMLTRTCLSDLETLVGTFTWAAPEILTGGHGCTSAVDIYSFGVVLWEIVTGERPARGAMRAPRVPAECPQEVAELIQRCMSLDPQKRPTAQALMQELSAVQRLRLPSPCAQGAQRPGSAGGAPPEASSPAALTPGPSAGGPPTPAGAAAQPPSGPAASGELAEPGSPAGKRPRPRAPDGGGDLPAAGQGAAPAPPAGAGSAPRVAAIVAALAA